MKTRCPCCGAAFSLDALVANEAAREALQITFRLSMPLGGAVVRYLALFRPKSTELSFGRLAKLLGEIVPDIVAGRITRNGQVYDAPVEAWLWAIEQGLTARDEGRLQLPLKGHGWLYEVISSWRPARLVEMADGSSRTVLPAVKASKTLSGLTALEALKHG